MNHYCPQCDRVARDVNQCPRCERERATDLERRFRDASRALCLPPESFESRDEMHAAYERECADARRALIGE